MKHSNAQKGFRAPGLLKCARGGGLLSSLVMLLGLSTGAYFFTQRISTGSQSSAAVAYAYDKEYIRNMLTGAVSCRATFSANPCSSAGRIINLFGAKANGSRFRVVANSGTKMGHWTVRAECAPSSKGIIVRVATLKPGAPIGSNASRNFNSHPLTKRVVTWSHPDSLLFPPGVNMCDPGGMKTVVTNNIQAQGARTERIEAPATGGNWDLCTISYFGLEPVAAGGEASCFAKDNGSMWVNTVSGRARGITRSCTIQCTRYPILH